VTAAVAGLAAAGQPAPVGRPARLRQLAGPGLLARHGALVLLCEDRPGQQQSISALLAALVAAAGSGRELGRRLAGLLGMAGPGDDFPALCAFGPADGGTVVLAHGRAEVVVTVGDRQLRLTGRDAVTLVDRLIPAPVWSIRAAVGDGPADAATDQWSQLESGVVRAGALVWEADPELALVPALAEDAGPASVPMPVPMPRPAAVPTGESGPAPMPVPTPAAVAVAVATENLPAAAEVAGPAGPARAGDPCPNCAVTSAAAVTAANAAAAAAAAAADCAVAAAGGSVALDRSAAAPAADQELLIGLSCRDGHLNDPDVPFCGLCGISMMQATGMPVVDRRPVLGVLVFDDGTAVPLDRDCVLGRAPEQDRAVVAGLAAALRLDDAWLSPVHARVLLDGWSVAIADAGSVTGTFLCDPGQESWTVLPPGPPVPLRPGARVAVGQRQLRYDSYRNP
jgi:hypothetical protein